MTVSASKGSLGIFLTATVASFALTAFSPQSTQALRATHESPPTKEEQQAGSQSPGQAEEHASVISMCASPQKTKDLLNPLSHIWSTMPQTVIGLYPQNIVAPHGGGSIKEVRVRAARTSSGVAIRLNWDDATHDNSLPGSHFGDAAAVEFPIAPVPFTVLAMGHPRGPVNIWHWQASPDLSVADKIPVSSQAPAPVSPAGTQPGSPGADLSAEKVTQLGTEPDQPKDAFAGQGSGERKPGEKSKESPRLESKESAIEDLIGAGTANLSRKPAQFQCLQALGIWRDGQWQVVIYKPFNKDDQSSPSFEQESNLNVAFAIWNGSQGDRGGMKSVSNWAVLHCK